MSKRRISARQYARIEKRQKQYHQPSDTDNSGLTADGLVIRRFGQHAMIESLTGTLIHCSIRPNIDTLVAGDRCIWQSEGVSQGVIVSRYPRQSVLGRPDKRGQIKPVAANISQVMVVVAPKPEVSWALLDSYLIMTEFLCLPTCIILNKIDLPCEALQQRLIQDYQPLGYSVLLTDHHQKKTHKQLQKSLEQQTSVFVGQSGVGKSSLILSILPTEPTIETGAISTRTNLGTHTTSSSHFYHLPTGGSIIDSPGIRELGLWHMPISEIAKGYREFIPFISKCKFRNCNHIDNIGCALIEAVKHNRITHHRYENYVKISLQFAKQ